MCRVLNLQRYGASGLAVKRQERSRAKAAVAEWVRRQVQVLCGEICVFSTGGEDCESRAGHQSLTRQLYSVLGSKS